MTVFKTYLKVLNKCKFTIILYTVFLIAFGGFNIKTSEDSVNFVETKPDILIINNDEEIGITKNLIDYIKDNSNIVKIENNEDKINDALFYRDVNYIIYIPENYRKDYLNKNEPQIEIKSTGDYQSSVAELLLERYLKVSNIYANYTDNESELINKINNTLQDNVEVEVTTQLDTDNLSKMTFYYNFTNYSIQAGLIYVICLILSIFKEKNIKKRTVISSMSYKKYNRVLLLSNSIFALLLWFIYVILSFILIGNCMFSMHGLIYIINSLVFTFCAVTIAFLIGNLISNKDAINGIVNVVALGTSFLCGAFVPVQYLPDFVLKIAHILPSYWYIQTNELLKTIEIINFNTIKPILINMLVIIIFSIAFIIISNIISRKKNKIG